MKSKPHSTSNYTQNKQKKDLVFTVDSECGLLEFLLNNIKGKSRNNIKSLLTRGDVCVNSRIRKRHDYILKEKDIVSIGQNKPAFYEINELLEIIYEDDELIVINKPYGLLSMSTDKEKDMTAYHFVTDYVKLKNQNNRVFIVHRLDRETSGIIMFAKTEKMKYALQDNWNDLVKYRGYTAVVEGIVAAKEGRIQTWLKETTTHLVYSCERCKDGLESITNYKVLKSSEDYSLVSVWLETGRKNQIRVHMKDMGNPVAGDKKYDAQTNPIKRLCLHAHKLEFVHPFNKSIMSFEVKAPKKMTSLVKCRE